MMLMLTCPPMLPASFLLQRPAGRGHRRLMAVLACALALVGAGCEPRQAPPDDFDFSFDLVDENGEAATSGDYSGHLRLVFFGYTSCPDICPVTLLNVTTAIRALGPLAEDIIVLFISVDPQRDRPEVLASYTAAFHPSVIGLTGSYEQLVEVTGRFRTTFGFNVTVEGVDRPLSEDEYLALEPGARYTPYHGSQVYMLGRDGELLDIIGFGTNPDLIEKKLREVLATE